jgi:hypothetical protein
MVGLKNFQGPLAAESELDSRKVLKIASRAMTNQPWQFAVAISQNDWRIRR